MSYITIKQPPAYRQITIEEMLGGVLDLSQYVFSNQTNTQTHLTERVNPKLLENTDINHMVEVLKSFNQTHEALFLKDRASLYRTFHIPKSSGGLRRIDAPEQELMDALRQLKSLMEVNMFALYHTTCFSYVKGRCTVDAIRRH